MRGILFYIRIFLIALTAAGVFSSCSRQEEEMKTPADIMGIWQPAENVYMEFTTNNEVRILNVEYQDGESIGIWSLDVYYYEPGYDLVIYLNSDYNAQVYQIVEMTDKKLTWCWVKELEITDAESVGKVIGEIITEAQEGFKLNPDYYQTFVKITEEEFYSTLESLDLEYPWW